VRQTDRAFVEHAGIDMHRRFSALRADRRQCRRQRRHMVPMAVADRDAFDFA
jgi:hypothetical protein